jgi:LPXTG-site transpeptidase (sortase) family protein
VKFATKALKIFIALTLLFYGVYAFINWPTITKLATNQDQIQTPSTQKKSQVATQVANLASSTSKASSNIISSIKIEASSQFKNDYLYYPKLGIEAVVEWKVRQADIQNIMPDSLVNLLGSALPEQNGDVLIAGHSSYYWWSKGKYKNVFAPLIKASRGEDIIIRKNDITYFYKVADIYQIGANDSLKLNVGGTSKNLYLITCVPVGTDLRRLVIRAEFVKSI